MQAWRGSSLRHVAAFEEAAIGVSTKIRIPRQEYCESCNGTGAKKGTGVVACQSCGGRGQIVYQQGFFTINRTCPACQGAGQIIKERCLNAADRGAWNANTRSTCGFRPEWIPERGCALTAKANPARMGVRPGDLYVVLDVKEHNFFERRGADLYCTIPISIAQASLGTELQVPGLNGEER